MHDHASCLEPLSSSLAKILHLVQDSREGQVGYDATDYYCVCCLCFLARFLSQLLLYVHSRRNFVRNQQRHLQSKSFVLEIVLVAFEVSHLPLIEYALHELSWYHVCSSHAAQLELFYG